MSSPKQVIVQTLTGKKETYKVDSNTTFADLKGLISKRVGLPIHVIRLIYNQRQRGDEKIWDVLQGNKRIIHLVLDMRPTPSEQQRIEEMRREEERERVRTQVRAFITRHGRPPNDRELENVCSCRLFHTQCPRCDQEICTSQCLAAASGDDVGIGAGGGGVGGHSVLAIRERRNAAAVATAQANLGKSARWGDAVAARKAVVEDGADVNAAVFDHMGTLGGRRTAAFLAASWGHIGVLGVLLVAPVHADPDKGDTKFGETPCMTACMNNHPDAVTLLLAHGADPNRADTEGWTPCMWAADGGYTACLRALAKGTAQQEDRTLDVNAMATDGYYRGKTALDLALDMNNEEAAAFLRDELGAQSATDLLPQHQGLRS